jgi:DNA-binding transcriptional regulator YhcF (GntR family)
MPIHFALDRALPVPTSVQLKGQIEYGIVSGALKPGEQLPSVRELAAMGHISHVTASHVYAALKREGLVEMRRGIGAFVAAGGDNLSVGNGLGELHRLVDGMVTQALDRGYTPAEISRQVTVRLTAAQGRRPVVALVGLFERATQVYAADVARLLADVSPDVIFYTLDRLRDGDAARQRVQQADVVLTMANRVKEVQGLLQPPHPPVRSLAFVARQHTVEQLQRLDPELQLGLITTFDAFLPTMLQGVMSYVAPRRAPLCAVLADTHRVQQVLARADAIVYASGSEAILTRLPQSMTAIEYLHAPEAASVAAVRPLLARFAASGPAGGRERGWDQAV